MMYCFFCPWTRVRKMKFASRESGYPRTSSKQFSDFIISVLKPIHIALFSTPAHMAAIPNTLITLVKSFLPIHAYRGKSEQIKATATTELRTTFSVT